MKTLTVRIFDKSGKESAWVRMSATRRFHKVMPEIGGPGAATLELMPDRPLDIETIGCNTAGVAHEAGLEFIREWDGHYDLEHHIPDDS